MYYVDLFGISGILLIISILGLLAVVVRTVSTGLLDPEYLTQTIVVSKPEKRPESAPIAPQDIHDGSFLPQSPLETELIHQAAKVGIIEQVGDNGTIRRSITLWLRDPIGQLPANIDDSENITIMGQEVKAS